MYISQLRMNFQWKYSNRMEKNREFPNDIQWYRTSAHVQRPFVTVRPPHQRYNFRFYCYQYICFLKYVPLVLVRWRLCGTYQIENILNRITDIFQWTFWMQYPEYPWRTYVSRDLIVMISFPLHWHQVNIYGVSNLQKIICSFKVSLMLRI